MILLHQEEVDLLKTVILFPRLPPTHPYISRDGAGWFSAWSASRRTRNLHHALFRRLACFAGSWPIRVAGLSVCRLVGGQQEWVLCAGQEMLEFLIEGNWKWALRSRWLVFSWCAMKGCRNHVLDSVVLNGQWKASLVDTMHYIGVGHTFTHKRRKKKIMRLLKQLFAACWSFSLALNFLSLVGREQQPCKVLLKCDKIQWVGCLRMWSGWLTERATTSVLLLFLSVCLSFSSCLCLLLSGQMLPLPLATFANLR